MMPSPEEDGRDPVDPSCSPDEPKCKRTAGLCMGDSGPTLSASSAPVPHHRVNKQKIGFNRDLSLISLVVFKVLKFRFTTASKSL